MLLVWQERKGRKVGRKERRKEGRERKKRKRKKKSRMLMPHNSNNSYRFLKEKLEWINIYMCRFQSHAQIYKYKSHENVIIQLAHLFWKLN